MKDYPLIKLVILLSAGILLSEFFQPDLTLIFVAAFSLILLTCILFFIKSKQINLFAALPVYVLTVIGGVIIHQSYASDADYLLPQKFYKQKDFTAFGTITNVELIREKDIVFQITTDSIKIFDTKIIREINLIGKIRDSKRKLDSVYSNLFPGNFVSIKGTYSKGREQRNPGEFDYNKYLNELGISGMLTAYDVEDFIIINNDKDSFKSLIFNCRKYLDNEINKLHDEQTASLLKGLILADRSQIDFETKTNFVNSGVIHVLAVSGLHVGYIALIFLFLFGRFNPYLRSTLTILGLLVFMFITGVPPSVLRATAMAVILIIAFLSNRSSNIFNSLALAALIILVINPNELFNPGFQLSFSAVTSIAVIYPLIQKEINSRKIKQAWLKFILLFASVSLSAQIGTLPFTLAYFNKLSLISLLANLIVIPLIGFILGIAFFTLALNIFSSFVASIASSVNELFSSFLFWLVNFSGSIDYSFIPIRQFSFIDGIIFYIFLVIALIFYFKIRIALSRLIFMILIFANIIFLCSLDDKELLSKDELNIMMIDIGQGDAILLQFPNGKAALIDAGETNFYFDNGERIILPLLKYLGIEKIDYAFISHMDSDHYSGFVSLVHNGIIKKIIKPPLDTSLTKDVKFENFVRSRNVPVDYYEKGIMKIGDVQIFILNENNNPEYQTLSTNDKSGLMKIVYGKTSFLFTGDMEKKAEKFYTKMYKNFLKSDMLKVGHHGSTTSSTPALVNFVNPELSIISAGIKNKFNHPSGIILSRLTSAGSKINRTDLEGAILYKSNGDSIYHVDWKSY